jgi:hypothetical protein
LRKFTARARFSQEQTGLKKTRAEAEKEVARSEAEGQLRFPKHSAARCAGGKALINETADLAETTAGKRFGFSLGQYAGT